MENDFAQETGNTKFAGSVFVTFNKIADKNNFVDAYKCGGMKRFFIFRTGLFKVCKARFSKWCYPVGDDSYFIKV